MTTHLFGIYGFNFFKPITVRDVSFIPLYENPTEVQDKANDKRIFHLTGYGKFEADISTPFDDGAKWLDKISLLQDALTVCEQQWILTSEHVNILIDRTVEESVGTLPRAFNLYQQRWTRGPLIAPQGLYPNDRQDFLNFCIEKLEDEKFDKQTDFRKAFYRQIETLRLRRRFTEIDYYLTFSALELLARKYHNDYKPGEVAALITPFLNSLGFQITKTEVQEWADLRNVLFHAGRFESEKKRGGKTIIVTEQEAFTIANSLNLLLPDVLLKLIQYDNGHINWNRWRDGMPFQ